ncbi:MAG: 3-dehydroquinate synthase [Acidobacteriaceae bacterium]|jgi:3-dehydroquinate synthase|nr:3-dehydroquinate synthase [Acidobacteriaceae bacterium]
MKAKIIRVRSAAGEYAVLCGAGILCDAAGEIAKLGEFSSVHVLTSPKVWRAAGKAVKAAIPRDALKNLHLFDDAETKKNMRTVETLCRKLTRAGADRKSLIIAVGGGVVGDVAGFVAASYLRGVALVHVPTTLVAQVDSSIGGKTGVNLPEGKNLVGAFYPPRLVIIDTDLLRTLPERQFRSGIAEVIKYGVIADAELFAYLEHNMEKLMRKERDSLEYVIPLCVEIKADVVGRDERESGLREILNFGHTFGHALESVTKYRRYLHGEAVAWGMISAALVGRELGITRNDDVSRIVSLIRKMGKMPDWPRVAHKILIAAMLSDKKTRAGKLRFVVSPHIGEAHSSETVSMDALDRAMQLTPKVLGRAEKMHRTGKSYG